MAITSTVTFVSAVQGGDQFGGDVLTGTVNLTIMQDAVELLNKDFSAPYKKVDSLTVDQQLARWATAIRADMQAVIDGHVNEQSVAATPQLAAAVTWIGANIDTSGMGT